MAKGFIRGALVGAVVSAAGLGVVSELVPLPTAPPPESMAKPESAKPEAPEAEATQPESAKPEATASGAAQPAAKADSGETPSPETAGDASAPMPPAPPAPEDDAGATGPTAPEGTESTAPAAPGPTPTPPATPGADSTPSQPAAPPASASGAAGTPEITIPGVKATPPKPIPSLPKVVDTLPSNPEAPKPGFAQTVPGVTVNRLPTVGDTAAPPAAQPGTDAGSAPQPRILPPPGTDDAGATQGTSGEAATGQAAQPADAPALERYAAPFDNPQGRPVFSIILIDTGGDAVDRVALTDLPLPVTFAIDPSRPDAAAVAQLYREAGREVMILAKGIPADASAADIATNIEGFTQAVPQAVGILDPVSGGFETDRSLSKKIVAQLRARGLGLVTYGQGLDAASQIARSEGLPSARIYRRLDAAGESAPKIARYLDRAAFKAAQDGRVVVVGHTTPDTIAALSEWAGDPRAHSVAPAPVTAALKP